MIKKCCVSALVFSLLCGSAAAGTTQKDTSLQNGAGMVENKLISSTKEEYDYYQGNLPAWMQRVDFNIYMQQYTKPIWYARTIQPIFQSKNDVFFTQDQLNYQELQSQTTSNIGFGYRHLLNNQKWILGINSFYDREWHFKHQRLGFGLEAIGQYATFRGNYYDALSNRRVTSVSSGITYYEEALNGYDASAEVPIPFLPWIRMVYTRYYWWRHLLSDIRGYKFEFDLVPTSNIEADLGMTDDNASRFTYYARLSWHFGRPARIDYALTTEPYSSRAFVDRNMKRHLLDYVKRENRIIVENAQSSGSSSGVIIARGN